MSEPNYKRPITVTVSGDHGAGKTALIALVSMALRANGHRTMVPPQSAGRLTNYRLDELFDVTFVEAEDRVFTGRQVEGEVVRRMEAARQSYEDKIAEFREANIELVKRLESQKRATDDFVQQRSEDFAKAAEAQKNSLMDVIRQSATDIEKTSAALQQARNALAESAIIITGLHQELRTLKGVG